MRFSLNFVKEFVDVKVGAKVLAETLTMAGMEVEYLEACGNDWLFDIYIMYIANVYWCNSLYGYVANRD